MSPDSRTGISPSSRLLKAGQRNCSTPGDLEMCLKCASMEQTEKPSSLSVCSWGGKGVNTMQSKHMGPYRIIRGRKNIFKVWTGGSNTAQEQLEHRWQKSRSFARWDLQSFLSVWCFSLILFSWKQAQFLANKHQHFQLMSIERCSVLNFCC